MIIRQMQCLLLSIQAANIK